jgi:hypothetical protein
MNLKLIQKLRLTMNVNNSIFALTNNATDYGIGNDSFNYENNKELGSCNAPVNQSPVTGGLQENVNEHETGTFIYLLSMLIMSNMLSSILRVFYR